MLTVLSGTSSSGKTSLARAMQQLSRRSLLHLEADRFAPTLRIGDPAAGDAAFRRRATLAMHEAIAVLGRHQLDVIVDGSLPTELALRDDCLSILRAVQGTRVVAVRCSLEALRKREAARADRSPGWAERQVELVYEGTDFDATVDTTELSPEDAARQVLGVLFQD